MKKYLHLIIYIAAIALVIVSCKRKDDIDDIFTGKTWYMMNGVFNGTKLPTQSFYAYDSNGYQLHFQENTFSGELAKGNTFSGSWTADGEDRSLSFSVTKETSTSSEFDAHVYNIIKNASYYTGDDNILTIYKDSHSSISLSTSRSSTPTTN